MKPKTRDVILGLEREIKRLKKEIEEQDAVAESLRERLKLAIAQNHRITTLLRRTLPEVDQVGAGVDGMIESLLARMNRLAMIAERERPAR